MSLLRHLRLQPTLWRPYYSLNLLHIITLVEKLSTLPYGNDFQLKNTQVYLYKRGPIIADF